MKIIYKKFLSLDIGTKYIGCAINIIPKNKESIKTLKYIKIKKNKIEYKQFDHILNVWNPDAIVIGKPQDSQFIYYYIKKLSKLISIKYDIKIFDICEHLTSWEAKSLYKKDKKEINSYSALIILKNFFSKK